MLQGVAVYHDYRRIHAALVGIAHFRAHQTGAWRGLALDGALQYTGDFRRRHFNHRRIIGLLDTFKQAVDAALFEGGNIVEFGKIEEIEFAGNVALNLLFALVVHAVPFVYRHHQRPARF